MQEPIGEDATAVFNMLSGYSEPKSWNKLACCTALAERKVSYNLIEQRNGTCKSRRRGTYHCKDEFPYVTEISSMHFTRHRAAGVKIELIVRGICCLKVGIPGVSENITVRSIVGNFLEHARIYYFENAGSPEVYMSSADWMPRNLERRVEILFPVEQEDLKEKAIHILRVQLADTLKAHVMQADGSYEKIDKRGKKLHLCTGYLLRGSDP